MPAKILRPISTEVERYLWVSLGMADNYSIQVRQMVGPLHLRNATAHKEHLRNATAHKEHLRNATAHKEYFRNATTHKDGPGASKRGGNGNRGYYKASIFVYRAIQSQLSPNNPNSISQQREHKIW